MGLALWLERNDRILLMSLSCMICYWDKMIFSTSLWAKPAGSFINYSIGMVQRNWDNL